MTAGCHAHVHVGMLGLECRHIMPTTSLGMAPANPAVLTNRFRSAQFGPQLSMTSRDNLIAQRVSRLVGQRP